jgi:predicted ATP-grasp superfamily ATP-dependent carboligase
VQVDYDDIPALVQQLEHHNVQTVICAIGMLGDACSEAQLNLIKAADQAHTVKRFITSEFGYMTREEYCFPIALLVLLTAPYNMAAYIPAGGKI